MPLLRVLRDLLNLTAAKFGCGVGLCGVCTVHVNGESTRSCVTPCKKPGLQKRFPHVDTASRARSSSIAMMTAALIWQLCDGNNTIDQIVDILSGAYPDAKTQIAKDAPDSPRRFGWRLALIIQPAVC